MSKHIIIIIITIIISMFIYMVYIYIYIAPDLLCPVTSVGGSNLAGA